MTGRRTAIYSSASLTGHELPLYLASNRGRYVYFLEISSIYYFSSSMNASQIWIFITHYWSIETKTVIYWDYYTNIKVEVHYKKLKQSCTFLGFQEN